METLQNHVGLSHKDKKKSRSLCIEALYIYQYKIETPSVIGNLDWIIGRNIPKETVVGYFQFLFFGVIKHQETIDELIQKFTHKHSQQYIYKIDRAILQFAIFSLLQEKEIPSVIIINEAIELAKKYSGIEGYKFINGVLDGVFKDISS